MHGDSLTCLPQGRGIARKFLWDLLLISRLGAWEAPGAQHKHSGVWPWLSPQFVWAGEGGFRPTCISSFLGAHSMGTWRAGTCLQPQEQTGKGQEGVGGGHTAGAGLGLCEGVREAQGTHLHVRVGCSPAASLPKDSCDNIWG